MNTKLISALSALALFGSFSAFADQSIDEINGAVTCQAGDDLTIVINQARTRFSVTDGAGNAAQYTVIRKDAGDVNVNYVGRTQKGSVAILAFDDRGDYFSFKRGKSLDVENCRKLGK